MMIMEEGSVAAGKRKRHPGKGKGNKANNKKLKMLEGKGKKFRVSKKMRNLFEKRARDYNSDDEDEEEEKENTAAEAVPNYTRRGGGGDDSEGSDDSGGEQEEEGDDIQSGIMKFTEGVRAFRLAFKNIIKKNVANDSLGPVLSGHKQLIAKKLAEEEAERKVKGEAKKEKHLIADKGHVKPVNYLDSHEKFLIGIATKGVVKLFNAVNKAQKAQKGLDPSKSKDAKVIRKRRKEAFFSELGKTSLPARECKSNTSSDPMNDEGPAWAPLRDNYMLTNPKLKDWDKMADSTIVEDVGRMSEDSGSDDG
ncbi:B-box type zinc finger protein with CCT domain isoform 1 [Hibiscus syriacus]|uniref:B-box type zinc finger protein with CCT domain isoform 1 n=1 Tax=Hibiscus syriacus TaxID=106335 RepID=A0A6A2X1U2_HIBSY|nr:RRP15-like protein [Hibiscus syriacus]KAE8668732.1 B-box type zinc finger protein with CCT domain isoform 1 [Hibiscus syriacus]